MDYNAEVDWPDSEPEEGSNIILVPGSREKVTSSLNNTTCQQGHCRRVSKNPNLCHGCGGSSHTEEVMEATINTVANWQCNLPRYHA